MDHDLARHEEVPTGGFTHSSPSDLCGTLKAMLMSSSFGVRSATARLLASLCNYGAPSVGDSTPSRDAEHSTKAGTFFRETLIAAGTTGVPVYMRESHDKNCGGRDGPGLSIMAKNSHRYRPRIACLLSNVLRMITFMFRK